jgi:deoxycytidine triphosphate deaminase
LANNEESSNTPKNNDKQSGIELLAGPEIKTLFCRNFLDKSIDQLGYDVRLGDVIRLITSGEERTLNEGEKVEVLPGETLIAKTEEILDLPNSVFAFGSPKMSLISQGLWAHGGKTDPGYNQPLTLGFMNVGNKPCTLTRGQPIFHLTFFRINGTERIGYAGKGINLPSIRSSPLDSDIALNDDVLQQVKESDGIQSYRICRYLYNIQRSSKRTNQILLGSVLIGNILAVGFALTWLTGNLSSTSVYGFIGALISETLVAAALLAIQSLASFFKKKE